MFIYIVASIITWFLTGLWHGANFTFIIWGMIHGFFLIIYQWQKSPRKKLFKKFGITNKNPIVIIIETLITLIIVMIAWVFFRSSSIHQANLFIAGIFSSSLFSFPQVLPKKVILITILFILAEWLQRNKQYALQVENVKYRIVRWGIYYGIIVLIFLSLGDSQQSFIYSKF
jgi:D-alanyl-lipoteichoic acid acyltransferase DltB (MBOAT superfamily)